MIIVGSTALFSLELLDNCRDLDIIGTYEERDYYREHIIGEYITEVKELEGKTVFFLDDEMGTSIVEFEYEFLTANGDIDTTAALLKLLKNEKFSETYADIDLCYALKMSHRYLKDSPHFSKTRNDIKNLQMLGAKIPDYLGGWMKHREQATYKYNHPALNVSKDTFFKDESFYKYDHDDIHKAVALWGAPQYTYYLADNEEVKCDKHKFRARTEHQRLLAVMEEAIVLVLERVYVPNNEKPMSTGTRLKWFRFALQKVATSITSGWFREYAYDNFDKVVDLYMFSRVNYTQLFKEALSQGYIANYKENK